MSPLLMSISALFWMKKSLPYRGRCKAFVVMMNHNEFAFHVVCGSIVALVCSKTSGNGFEGVMRIQSPRPPDWHAITYFTFVVWC